MTFFKFQEKRRSEYERRFDNPTFLKSFKQNCHCFPLVVHRLRFAPSRSKEVWSSARIMSDSERRILCCVRAAVGTPDCMLIRQRPQLLQTIRSAATSTLSVKMDGTKARISSWKFWIIVFTDLTRSNARSSAMVRQQCSDSKRTKSRLSVETQWHV